MTARLKRGYRATGKGVGQSAAALAAFISKSDEGCRVFRQICFLLFALQVRTAYKNGRFAVLSLSTARVVWKLLSFLLPAYRMNAAGLYYSEFSRRKDTTSIIPLGQETLLLRAIWGRNKSNGLGC